MLARLGVIDFVEANLERPTELIIREMTAEEAADIRRQAEAADAGDGSSTDAEADASPQAMPDAGGS